MTNIGDGLLDVALTARARAASAQQAGAWIALASEQVLRERVAELARLAAADRATLPLLGLTFGVKDNIDVAGWETTAACPGYGSVATDSAPAVQRLLDAGAILIGKTNLDQFATGLVGTRSPYGTPLNALDPELVPGGSSSGSAIAVAGGAVDVALGTDTAGSGRVPAALNGVVGVKPTRGLVSTRGLVPACRSLDCVSIFARDVATAARVLDAIAGFDPEDPYSRRAPIERPAARAGAHPAPAAEPAASPVSASPAGAAPVAAPRVGVPDLALGAFDGDVHARDAFAAACDRLAARGVELVPVDGAPLLRAGELLYEGPWVAERAAAVGAFVRERPEAVLPVTRELVLRGFAPSAVEAFTAQYELEALRAQVRALFEPSPADARQPASPAGATSDARQPASPADAASDARQLDAILLPTIPTLVTLAQDAADPLGRNAVLGRFTHGGNLLDMAALAVPGPPRADGGPAGAMLVGPAFRDRALLELGARFLDEPPLPPISARGEREIELLVVGAHMSGMPLEPQLRALGGRPLAPARTAPGYRMLALTHLAPPRPGLVADPHGPGGLAGELWALPPHGLGTLLTQIVAPLGLGPVALDDGREVVGFICSPAAVPDAPDITALGGWRAYVDGRPRGTPAVSA